MIVALSLSLAGVADDVIAEDYALSADCLSEEFELFLAGVSDQTERERLRERMSSRPETMLHMLTHLRKQHGDAEGYALAHGLGPERIKRIRDRLRADSQ
jgi:protein-tyrosine phosphatase